MSNTKKDSLASLPALLGNEYVASLQADSPGSVAEHLVSFLQQGIFRNGSSVSSTFLSELLVQMIEYLHQLPNVLEVSRFKNVADSTFQGRVTVIGDLHGQFRDLETLLNRDGLIGIPSSQNQIIVNGDMIDRGDMSIEILVVLMVYVLLEPGSVHLLRGNHEHSSSLRKSAGFDAELERKYPRDETLRWFFAQLFDALPIAAALDGAVFVVHGGLGSLSKNMTVAQINKEDRFEKSNLLHELLWNDPSDTELGITANSRGAHFGADITAQFLSNNKLHLLVRSHEYSIPGYSIHHNNLCYTVFSAPNYCGITNNAGAILRFDSTTGCVPTIVQFNAVHYPTTTADSDESTE